MYFVGCVGDLCVLSGLCGQFMCVKWVVFVCNVYWVIYLRRLCVLNVRR